MKKYIPIIVCIILAGAPRLAFAQCTLHLHPSGKGCVGDTVFTNKLQQATLLKLRGPHMHKTYLYNTTSGYGHTVAGQANGLGGSDSSTLNTPTGVFVDKKGNLYIADNLNNRIQKWAPGALYGTTVAGDSTGGSGTDSVQLNSPAGIFVTDAGDLYIADANNNRVQLFKKGWKYGITVAGQASGLSGFDSASLSLPSGVFVDAHDTVYVADVANNRVQKWAPHATYGITVAGDKSGASGCDSFYLSQPSAVTKDDLGQMYVTDFFNNRVQMYKPGSRYGITVAGSPKGLSGSDSATLSNPTTCWVDHNLNLYVSDRFNNRVQEWPLGLGYGITVAGHANGKWGNDSTAFNAPTGVCLDTSGAIYIADGGNNRVQKWTQTFKYLNSAYYMRTDTQGIYAAVATFKGGCLAVAADTIHDSTRHYYMSHTCHGQAFTFNSKTFNTSGIYKFTLANRWGCDSNLTLFLTIYKTDTVRIKDTIHPGKPVVIHHKSYSVPGIYPFYKYYKNNLCDSIDTLYYIAYTTGLNDIPHEKPFNVQVYPNPTSGSLYYTLDNPPHGNKGFVKIYNSLGQQVTLFKVDQYNGAFDCSHLAEGVYIFKWEIEGAIISRRFTVVH
jgi:sugar lactone lactonase YvrE